MVDDLQISEQDLAAQLGFSSFGGPPKSKKRKVDLVSVDINHSASAPTEEVSRATLAVRQEGSQQTAAASHAPEQARSNNNHRFGIRNEHGDVAYFMPSFIEDPWAELIKKRGE